MGLVDSLLEQLDQPRHFPAQFRSFSNLGLSLVCLLQQHAPSQCPIRLLKCLRFISPASLQPVMSRLSTGLFMFGLQTARAPCDWAAIVSRRRPLERDRGCGGSFSGLGAAQALSRACSNAAEQFRFRIRPFGIRRVHLGCPAAGKSAVSKLSRDPTLRWWSPR